MTTYHALIKIETKSSNNQTDTEKTSDLIESISNLIGTTIIDSIFHEFGPSGLTAAALLKESHIAIHTWPEENLVIIDILSCKVFPDKVEENLRKIISETYNIHQISVKTETV